MSITYPQYPATTFPDSFQAIEEFLDITPADANNLINFQTNYLAGNTQVAQTFLQAIPNYSQKLITAQKMNQISDTIQALEKFYGSDITTIITNKQNEWQEILDQFSYFGTYVSSGSVVAYYDKNNIVSFTDPDTGIKNLYLCLEGVGSSTTNTPNVDTTHWLKLTIQGSMGESGIAGSFAFDWNSSTNYSVNTVVVYDDKWWMALQSNSNQTPAENQYWTLVLDFSPSKYPVQSTTPTNQLAGDLWFKTL